MVIIENTRGKDNKRANNRGNAKKKTREKRMQLMWEKKEPENKCGKRKIK